MRIVNKKEFLKLPRGTLYCGYTSIGIMNGLEIKEDTLSKDSFFFTDFMGSVGDNTDQYMDEWEKGEKDSSYEIPVHFGVLDRDSSFDNEPRYIIFNKKETEEMIKLLQATLIRKMSKKDLIKQREEIGQLEFERRFLANPVDRTPSHWWFYTEPRKYKIKEIHKLFGLWEKADLPNNADKLLEAYFVFFGKQLHHTIITTEEKYDVYQISQEQMKIIKERMR